MPTRERGLDEAVREKAGYEVRRSKDPFFSETAPSHRI